MYHDDTHRAAEMLIATVARSAAAAVPWCHPLPYDGPVRVEIVTWHRRPGRLCRKRDRGCPGLPYIGKPDADNVAKLVLDALTKARVWTDDTRVAELEVVRRWVPLGEDGQQGEERTEVAVWPLEVG